MPISRDELIRQFGAAAEYGNGVLFVGAGLSVPLGLPTWPRLIEGPRLSAGVPSGPDAPLLAEYIAHKLSGGRDALNQHVLKEITERTPSGADRNHELIDQLGVKEVWTTNYDRCLESACKDAAVIIDDDTVKNIGTRAKTIVKMHGSVAPDGARWEAPPILTRGDYERYEDSHRRLWTLLHATYLSRTLLFIGFSFSDPNIELLQKLARRYGMAKDDNHLAIMRRPPGSDERARYELQRDDLERSGISICEIEEFNDLTGVLESLVVRTRPTRLFVSGSCDSSDKRFDVFRAGCEQAGALIGREGGWEIASLGGAAGWMVSRRAAVLRQENHTYEPTRILFLSRKKDDQAKPLEERIGTLVHSPLDREDLVKDALSSCRALLSIRGGTRSAEEIGWAEERRVGVVPLAALGGAARDYWRRTQGSTVVLGGKVVAQDDWALLGNEDLGAACTAAMKLLRQAMFLT